MRIPRNYWYGMLLAAIAAAALYVLYPQTVLSSYERGMLSIAPSAERAYQYGNRHFDATHPVYYDLDRAEYFFNTAISLDSSYPYVQHQLARMAFLEGDFATALARINLELEKNPEPAPSSYYIRGLIKGFMGDYEGSADDYAIFLRAYPTNWAAINDYAWVLMKASRPGDALVALDAGIVHWPENPWLHNSRASALFGIGRYEEAREAALKASHAVEQVTEEDWLQAYPGNDPLIAPQGLEEFKKAVEENMHTIDMTLKEREKSVR